MTVNQLITEYDFSAVVVPNGDRDIKGGYAGDLLSWVMGRAESDMIWVTIMSNLNIVAVASLTDVACVLLAENVSLDEEVIRTAKEKGINILSTSLSTFDAISLITKAL